MKLKYFMVQVYNVWLAVEQIGSIILLAGGDWIVLARKKSLRRVHIRRRQVEICREQQHYIINVVF